jgi:hypothetical protein
MAKSFFNASKIAKKIEAVHDDCHTYLKFWSVLLKY